jgi:ubiquinone/menaquinone biosynthesis C-methylase UbiE
MTAEYFNNLAVTWDAKYAENNTDKLEEMASRLDIAPGASVIDIGSGTGIFVPFILRKIGDEGHLTCVDPACEMLRIAQDKGLGDNILYLCAGIENTGLEAAAFDAAVCYSSFPHFGDKLKALREINRLLKPGGKLFICHTSSRDHINNIHGRIPILKQDTIPDEEEMRRLLASAGFTGTLIEDSAESYLARASKGNGK